MSVPEMLEQKSDQTKLILEFIFSKNYEDPGKNFRFIL